jgi:hypothetical protein
MKYLLALEQDGEGCGYMIGCGETSIEFEADNDEQAMVKAKELWIGDNDYDPEREPYCCWMHGEDTGTARATLCRVVQECPHEEWAEEVDAAIEAYERKEEQAADLAELERLKRKLGES